MERKRILFFIITVLLCIQGTGCGGQQNTVKSEKEFEKEIVTLKAITIGNPPADGLDSFYEQLDALTEELGCRLRFDYIPWGDERKQLNMAVVSGKYDFISNGVFSDYYQQIEKGAFLDLNDYRDVVPELFEHYECYREDYLTGLEVNGGLYGIPQFKEDGLYRTGDGFFYRTDLLEEWGIEPVTDFDSMERYLYTAKKDPRYKEYSMVTDNRVWTSLWAVCNTTPYIEIVSVENMPYAVVDAANPQKVVSRFETEEFKNILKIVQKWYNDGILTPSLLASTDNEGNMGLEMMSLDTKPCETNAPVWTVNDYYIPALSQTDTGWTYGFMDYSMSSTFHWKKSVGKELSCISISSRCSYPEIAVKLLEKAHTDQRYHDLLNYGVEGEHYTLKDGYLSYEGVSGDNIYKSWTAALDFTMERKIYAGNDQWQEVYDNLKSEENKLSEVSEEYPLNGFEWDGSGFSEVEEDLEQVRRDYLLPLCCGVSDNLSEDYEIAIEKLYEAGLQKYLDEVQNQLNNYWGKQG